MTLYEQRMKPFWDQLTRGNTQEDLNFNKQLMLGARQGDYLIKSQEKWYCLQGEGYISYTFKNKGWFFLSTRKNAQWFSREEAVELIKKFPKFKIVKKS